MEIELRNSGGAYLGSLSVAGRGEGEAEGTRPQIGPTESSACIYTVARKHLSYDTAHQPLLTLALSSLLIVAINGVRLINCATGP